MTNYQIGVEERYSPRRDIIGETIGKFIPGSRWANFTMERDDLVMIYPDGREAYLSDPHDLRPTDVGYIVKEMNNGVKNFESFPRSERIDPNDRELIVRRPLNAYEHKCLLLRLEDYISAKL